MSMKDGWTNVCINIFGFCGISFAVGYQALLVCGVGDSCLFLY